MKEKLKSIKPEEIKDASKNGVQWMILCGCESESEAKELADRFVGNVKFIRQQMKF